MPTNKAVLIYIPSYNKDRGEKKMLQFLGKPIVEVMYKIAWDKKEERGEGIDVEDGGKSGRLTEAALKLTAEHKTMESMEKMRGKNSVALGKDGQVITITDHASDNGNEQRPCATIQGIREVLNSNGKMKVILPENRFYVYCREWTTPKESTSKGIKSGRGLPICASVVVAVANVGVAAKDLIMEVGRYTVWISGQSLDDDTGEGGGVSASTGFTTIGNIKSELERKYPNIFKENSIKQAAAAALHTIKEKGIDAGAKYMTARK